MRISSTRLATNPKVSVSPLLSSLILQSPYAQQPQSRFRGRFLHAMASDSPQLGVTNGKPTYQPRYIDVSADGTKEERNKTKQTNKQTNA